MSAYVDCGYGSAKAGEALLAFRCVKLSADNTVVYADAGDAPDAVTTAAAASDAGTDVVVGKAWKASSADGDLIEVQCVLSDA